MKLAMPLLAMFLAGSSAALRAPAPEPPLILPAPTPPQRLFISGHSLTDAPYPDYLGRIARSLGHPVEIAAHSPFGSTIRARLLARDSPAASGDSLVFTEQHTLLGNILWNDTVRQARRLHDRHTAAATQGQSFLFTAWLGLDSVDRPERWIAYERAADTLWRCVALRINRSLLAEGRSAFIHPLPTALALAELVGDAPGIAPRLFRDDVHLTDLGAYYVALISYAFLFSAFPDGAWAPGSVSSQEARALQQRAWRFRQHYARASAIASLDQCRDYLRRFVPHYLAYQRDVSWRSGGAIAAYAKWARHSVEWPRLFARRDSANPFHYDPARDLDYWRQAL